MKNSDLSTSYGEKFRSEILFLLVIDFRPCDFDKTSPRSEVVQPIDYMPLLPTTSAPSSLVILKVVEQRTIKLGGRGFNSRRGQRCFFCLVRSLISLLVGPTLMGKFMGSL